MKLQWHYETPRRSLQILPEGIYHVQIERAVSAVSASKNEMIIMKLGVLGYEAKVTNNITLSKKHARLVNKLLREIYSSFGIPEGNLEPETWVNKVGVAKLEPSEFNGIPCNRVSYFLTKKQQEELGLSIESPVVDTVEAVVEEDDDDEYFPPYRRSSFACLRR